MSVYSCIEGYTLIYEFEDFEERILKSKKVDNFNYDSICVPSLTFQDLEASIRT